MVEVQVIVAPLARVHVRLQLDLTDFDLHAAVLLSSPWMRCVRTCQRVDFEKGLTCLDSLDLVPPHDLVTTVIELLLVRKVMLAFKDKLVGNPDILLRDRNTLRSLDCRRTGGGLEWSISALNDLLSERLIYAILIRIALI